MYNSSLILLHRPFVSGGHLHSSFPSIAADSLIVCATAAKGIIILLELYQKAYSFSRPTYTMYYSAYLSATIYVRIAAHVDPGNEAFAGLRLCLAFFEQNQERTPAVRNAFTAIRLLMHRLGLEIKDDHLAGSVSKELQPATPTKANEGGSFNMEPVADARPDQSCSTTIPAPVVNGDQGWCPTDFDVEAVLQSFTTQQQTKENAELAAQMYPSGQGYMDSGDFDSSTSSPWMDSNGPPFMADAPNLPDYGLLQPYGTSYGDMLFGFDGQTLIPNAW